MDLYQLTIRVHGKGGHERVLPLNPEVSEVLRVYVHALRAALPTAPFFRSRFGRQLSRGSIYERVPTWGSAAAAVFRSLRTACGILLPRIWCAPEWVW